MNKIAMSVGLAACIFLPGYSQQGEDQIYAEYGATLLEERGRYAISGNQVRLVFSDGSSMVLVIEQGGRKLHSCSSGMLMAEYFFLGTGK